MHAENSGDFCILLISYHFVMKISADMNKMSPREQGKTFFRKSCINSNQTDWNSVNICVEIGGLAEVFDFY